MLPGVMTSKSGHCEGYWHLCTCDYVLTYLKPWGTSAYDYCGFQVNSTLPHFWDHDNSLMPHVLIGNLCPASCALHYAGPCSPGERPPVPPSPPPPLPGPPPGSYSYAPCTNTLHLISTVPASTQAQWCGGQVCTCEYVITFWKGTGTPHKTYCESSISDRLGHMFSPGPAPEGYIYDVCKATCANYYAGPCAPPAPPMMPPPPQLPPFPDCVDQMPMIFTAPVNYCNGNMAFCTCNYILDKWRGSDSGLAYCNQMASAKLGHMFIGNGPNVPIYQLCPQTCAMFGTGPCAPPMPPTPPDPPALPPFPPCADQMPSAFTNPNAASLFACPFYPDAGYESASFDQCTCNYILSKYNEGGLTSQIDFCTRLIADLDEMAISFFSYPYPDKRIHDICPTTCGASPILKGPCAPDKYPIWREACCNASEIAAGRRLGEEDGGGGGGMTTASFQVAIEQANGRFFAQNPLAYKRHLDAKQAQEEKGGEPAAAPTA